MKKFSKTTIIFTLFCSSVVIAQDSASETQEARASQQQDQKKEEKEKPYTGWMLDAINGANSPEQYRVKKEDDAETRLKKQYINAIYTQLRSIQRRVQAGEANVVFLLEAYQQLLEAQDELFANDLDQRINAAEDMLQYAKSLETQMRQLTEAAVSRPDDWAKAVAYRLKCQLHLLRLEKQKK